MISFQTNLESSLIENIEAITPESIWESDTLLKVSDTPNIFKIFNLLDKDIMISRAKLAKGLYLSPSIKHGHSGCLNKKVVIRTLKNLADPLMIIKDDDGSFIAYYDVQANYDIPVLLVLRDEGSFNFIPSLYASKNRIREDKILYIDDTKFRNPQTGTSKKLAKFTKDVLYKGFKNTKSNFKRNSILGISDEFLLESLNLKNENINITY